MYLLWIRTAMRIHAEQHESKQNHNRTGANTLLYVDTQAERYGGVSTNTLFTA